MLLRLHDVTRPFFFSKLIIIGSPWPWHLILLCAYDLCTWYKCLLIKVERLDLTNTIAVMRVQKRVWEVIEYSESVSGGMMYLLSKLVWSVKDLVGFKNTDEDMKIEKQICFYHPKNHLSKISILNSIHKLWLSFPWYFSDSTKCHW